MATLSHSLGKPPGGLWGADVVKQNAAGSVSQWFLSTTPHLGVVLSEKGYLYRILCIDLGWEVQNLYLCQVRSCVYTVI